MNYSVSTKKSTDISEELPRLDAPRFLGVYILSQYLFYALISV